MAYVQYYYDPSEPNGAYDENTLAGCVNGGEGYEKVDSSSSASSARKETIYFCIGGVPSGATITNIKVDFQCKHLTWQNAGGILYKTDLKWQPVLLQNYALSGSKITSLGTVTNLASLASIYSKTGTFTSYTSKSYNASFSKTVSGSNLVGVAFEIGSYNTLGDIHFWFKGVNITVTYTVPTYTVTWKNADGTVLETDTGVASGATPTYNGATPTKAATAQYTYTFSGWSPAVGAITGNTTYTAQFTATVRKYAISTAVSSSGGGTVTGGGTYEYGKTATLTAKANDGYKFVKWNDGNKSATRTINVTGAATYTAYFAVDKILIGTTKPTAIYLDETNKIITFVVSGTITDSGVMGADTVDGYHIKISNSAPQSGVLVSAVYIDETKVYG